MDRTRKKAICDYYFAHGESILKAVNKFGYTSISCLKLLVKQDKRYKKKKILTHFNNNNYSDSDKIMIINKFVSRTSSGKNTAKELELTKETIYHWYKAMTGEKMKSKKNSSKEEILSEIEKLKKERNELELESNILRKANEFTKKEIDVNYGNLTNKEKNTVINALKDKYNTKILLNKLNIKKSFFIMKIVDFLLINMTISKKL